MKNTDHETLTRKTASRLENRIYTGIYPPGTPLPGTRKLAEEFRVSQRIVLRALDILEKKDILVRQERRKVYVKSRAVAESAGEILFFAFGDHLEEHGIYQTVNRMILQVGKERRFDFFSRVISSAEALSEERLERELARLENLGFIDGALVYCFLDEARMRKFLNLPYPVVFIGELPDSGILPEGARLISPNSADLLLSAARYAVRTRRKQLVLVCWERPVRHRYERQALEKLERFAAEHSLALQVIPVAGRNIEEACRNFERQAPAVARRLEPGTLLAAHNLHSAAFDAGELLRARDYPGLDFLTLSLPHDRCRIKYVGRDFTAMRRAIVNFLEKNDTANHITVDYRYRIIDPQSGRKELS